MVVTNQVSRERFLLTCVDCKGPFKYYIIKEVGGWGCQMMMFDDKWGGGGWLNADMSKKYTLCLRAQKKMEFSYKKTFLCVNFFMSNFFCVIVRVIKTSPV